MQYKYELHAHTGEVSRCGHVAAQEIARLYKQEGYNGIVITDHYSPMTFPLSKVLCPQGAVDSYLAGYRNAKKAEDDGFSVLLGMELRYYATINDYLVYGVTEDFLYNCGNLMKLYPKRFYSLAKKNGLLVVQAHPFRKWMIRSSPYVLDGSEIYNGKDDRETNDKALAWAEKNRMKIRTAGSDFHSTKHLAGSGIVTDVRIRDNETLLKVLERGEFDIIRRE